MGHPTKSLLAEVDSLMKDLDLQGKDLAVKINREAINKRELVWLVWDNLAAKVKILSV